MGDFWAGLWSATLGGAHTWLVEQLGFAGAVLVWFLLVFLIVLARLSYSHYRTLLKGAREADASEKTIEDYQTLRASLAMGGRPGQIYEQFVSDALGRVDRFFGDAEHADRSWPSPFGNKTSAPFWTAFSYDRCLGLAVAYPLMSLLIVWLVSGITGPAETALALDPDLPNLKRAVMSLSMFAIIFSVAMILRAERIHIKIICFVLGLAASQAVVVAEASFGIGVLAFAIAIAGTVAVAIHRFERHKGWALTAFTILLLASLPMIVWFVQGLYGQKGDVPISWILLVFLGALPLLNAIFDWTSLGFTRALIRRGLEKHGWWPVIYAFIDLAIASLMLLLLMGATIFYIQILNQALLMAGGPPAFEFTPLMQALRDDPVSPALWWLYITIFTTFLPSLFNLALGGAALTRGIPNIWHMILNQHLPHNRDVPEHRIMTASSLLAMQWVIGALLSVLVVWTIGIVIFRLLPFIGVWLQTGSTWLIERDIPASLATYIFG